jgi:hypothetical protein
MLKNDFKKRITLKLSIFVILVFVAFQLHAKDEVDKVNNVGKLRLDKLNHNENGRLEKLEVEVSKLGAERERARAAKQGVTITQTKHNVHGVNGSKNFDFLEIEKHRLEELDIEVSKLGAERARIRATKKSSK